MTHFKYTFIFPEGSIPLIKYITWIFKAHF